MKATRRQELRANDLAQMLQDLRDSFRAYGNYVVGVVVIIGAVILVWFYLQYSASEALAEATRQARALPYNTDAEVRSSVSKLKELTAEIDDGPFLAEALQRAAAMAMSRAQAGEDGTPSAEFLDMAADAYQELLERLPHRTLEKGVALFGLATIEGDRFVLDRDLSHQDKARQYLERIRDAAEFNGTPHKAVALEQLNRLDDLFVVIALADPLPLPTITPLPPALQPLPSTPPSQLPSTANQPPAMPKQPPGPVHPDAPGITVRQSGIELIPIAKDEVPPKAGQIFSSSDEDSEPPAEQSEEASIDESASDSFDAPAQASPDAPPEPAPPPTEDSNEQPE